MAPPFPGGAGRLLVLPSAPPGRGFRPVSAVSPCLLGLQWWGERSAGDAHDDERATRGEGQHGRRRHRERRGGHARPGHGGANGNLLRLPHTGTSWHSPTSLWQSRSAGMVPRPCIGTPSSAVCGGGEDLPSRAWPSNGQRRYDRVAPSRRRRQIHVPPHHHGPQNGPEEDDTGDPG